MPSPDAQAVVALARAAGLTVATAESLTGGALCAALIEVPGASACVVGGVVAYDTELKHRILGVDRALLEDPGPVSREVVTAMAAGARSVTGAHVGVATTGSAGPAPHGGVALGTVWMAVDVRGETTTRVIQATGGRELITAEAVSAALELLREALD